MVHLTFKDLLSGAEFDISFNLKVLVCGLCKDDAVIVKHNDVPIAWEYPNDEGCAVVAPIEYEQLTYYAHPAAYLLHKGIITRTDYDRCKSQLSWLYVRMRPTIALTNSNYYYLFHVGEANAPFLLYTLYWVYDYEPPVDVDMFYMVGPPWFDVRKITRIRYARYQDNRCRTYEAVPEDTYDVLYSIRLDPRVYGLRWQLFYINVPTASPARVCVRRRGREYCANSPIWNGKVTYYDARGWRE